MSVSRSAVSAFDPDLTDRPAVARQLDFADHEAEVPRHVHRKGQLILALRGAVTCTADNEIWIVPPHCGVWIPGGVPHSARATENARLNYLFVEPGAATLPEECCTLSVSLMIQEIIDRLAREGADYPPDSHAARLARVVLDELVEMPRERFNLPISNDPKIRAIADAWRPNRLIGDIGRLGEACRHERKVASPLDDPGDGLDVRTLAAAVAPCCRASGTGERCVGAECGGRVGLRVGQCLHHNV